LNYDSNPAASVFFSALLKNDASND